jgi:peroxiredoxin
MRRADLAALAQNPAVLFFYPRTGGRGQSAGPEWDLIPGARGCTPQACALRDLHRVKRMGWYLDAGRIASLWYPAFTPDKNGETVLAWLRTSRCHGGVS